MGNTLKSCFTKDNIGEDTLEIVSDTQEGVGENELYEINESLKSRAYDLESRLLEKYSYPMNNSSLYYEDVEIPFNGAPYLHTLTNFNAQVVQKPVVLMLHGYQGSSLNFFKIIPYIHEKFTVFAPDLIGMGLSSRINSRFEDAQSVLDFFADSIHAFVEAIRTRHQMNFEQIILVGHSMGGYIALAYAAKHPEIVKKLLLFSPVGISDNDKYQGDITENMPFYLRYAQPLVKKVWDKQLDAKEISRKFGVKYLLNFSLRRRYDVTYEENDLLGAITKVALQYPRNLDSVVYTLFKHPFPTAAIPYEEVIKEKIPDMPIVFCYGDDDWVDTAGAKRLNVSDAAKYKFINVYNSGHLFILESPGEAAKIIINEAI